MLHRLIFVSFLVSFSLQVKAQYDTYMFYQGLNQMYMNVYQQQQAADKVFIDAINAEMKRMDVNAAANCVMLPQSDDCFLRMMYINSANIDISVKYKFGFIKFITSDLYSVVGANIITNSILEPGMTIYVKRKDTNKILVKSYIPSKDSKDYEKYLIRSYTLS